MALVKERPPFCLWTNEQRKEKERKKERQYYSLQHEATRRSKKGKKREKSNSIKRGDLADEIEANAGNYFKPREKKKNEDKIYKLPKKPP